MCLNERHLSASFVSTLNIVVWGESVCAKDVCSAFFFLTSCRSERYTGHVKNDVMAKKEWEHEAGDRFACFANSVPTG